MKRKVFLSFLLILLTVINAYSNEANQSVNSFDDKLFESLYSQDENVNYSSLSIYSLLYALAKGSDKQTFQQIKDVIDYTPSRDFDNQMLKLMSNTENMSNSLWYKNSLEFKDDYKLFMSDFNFTAKPVDFTKGPQVRKEINQFISNKTKKLINNFLSQDLPSSTRLVLLNTLYFNQKWKKKFNKNFTSEEVFFKKADTKINVQMMHQKSGFYYFDDEEFQMLELPYGDDRYSMIIFLPKTLDYDFSKTSPSALVQKFELNKGYESIELSFPKFDLSNRYDLIPTLQKLGMTDVFNSQTSDLSKIFTKGSDIYVDSAIHQVKITVNEKETKAVAVTMFGAKGASFTPQRSIVFKADHPFCYVIRDKELDINLFTGLVRDPKSL